MQDAKKSPELVTDVALWNGYHAPSGEWSFVYTVFKSLFFIKNGNHYLYRRGDDILTPEAPQLRSLYGVSSYNA
ncbi:hypothetical protein E2C01_046770 [Portunus trituberculatus]|uniref:Uncharacterized protein n=1 Tax=Portunus trituberculatus TaxID=210409 RepID=A0A5B7FYN6_PORTR|nr:hypothetical protein [Portunus trituberculatus]